ncbi:helix-turn-helix domain-containing protein [Shewanella sp. 202IG2-18]|uniref:helix-turn-helix domain-containing protein n=1 Tax=Parashewanella hymeniacidonis TaxID=2807618 RepID=UPI00195F5984|nr:helix-turn-helix domain-containing protein [Parashewanella hymeniacidonis]MBM7070904.1 helix-turn-helix domain-containing protein [Parashewanella hymeniacidonis]
MEDKILIGQRIRAAREKLNLSQEELGRLMEISFQSVQQWESGKTTPRASRMRRLASVLKTTPNWLQFGLGISSNENIDNSIKLITSDEFKTQIASAHSRMLQTAISMGWISFGRSEITMSILNDLFLSKLYEEYGLNPNEDENESTDSATG